ncbi:transient receptor potential cation channel subfamily M member 2-like isoform X2 [Dendronephthya gigantea]|uniref:transient receptor potential cation channel subfamily M member 2-like isoform X2 n=1 Tax=Dendronephthya gigantea TaxID=151771 RepID=UPI00106BAC56|nr:transient receptor potential cation channel subfamily M member 2-like isoform X2 [Dendronephthya gigantea]
MVSLKLNKIDTVSPLRTGLALSPRKKPLRSKSTGSLGSHASTWDAKGRQSWIHENFFQRDCFKFVANPKKTSGDVCRCGRTLANHKAAITNHNAVDWTPETCTKKAPTNAFGEIQFVGSVNQSARAPYVRLAEDTNVELVMRLILKVWKLEVPNLVISVTGGAKSFHLKPRLKEVFQRGLIKAAKSTGAWIITGGTHTGVMKHVGEAVRQIKVVGGASSDINVIGVATWGIVDRDSDLTSESGLGKHPARYRTTPEETSKAPLDSSHTHFLLVDNGTVGQYGVEIDLRSKVEEAIAKMHTESRSSTGSIEVPVVMLVLEGGPGTVKTMTEAIKKKIPAVVIDGSGRAADVVAFAYKHTIASTKNGKNIQVIDPAYKELVEAKVVEIFGEKSLDHVYSMIEDVVEDEKMVTIYRLDEGGNTSRDIDLAILKALLKASRSSPLTQLNLALAWNRVDVAESDIFTENTSFKSEDLHNPMLTALVDDKADFVRLFLENGLSMREFLTVDRLSTLYRSVSSNGVFGSLIRHEMKKRVTKFITPQLIGYVIEDLMGDSYHSYYLSNVRYFSEPQRNTSQFIRIRTATAGSFVDVHNNPEGGHPLPFPFLDTFTWAILSGKKDLAKLLWEKGTQPIATALFATKLLKEMVRYSQEDSHQIIDETEGLLDLADEFESLAVSMLDTCYLNDEDLAQSLLVRALEPFGWLTCMDIGQLAEDQEFIAHSSCQILFNRLWMGGIVLDTPWWKVLLCVFFPFLIYPMIYFMVDEYEDSDESFQNQEDLNMNTEKDRSEVAKNKDAVNSHKHYNNSIELVELQEEKEEEKNNPKVTQSRHNLLSEGEDDAVDNVLRVSDVNCFQRILRFYEAPFTKFVTNVCSYVAFLGMFFYVILMDFQKYNVSIVEYVLMGWVGVLILEEVRQMLSQHPKHFYEKINLYMADAWNFVDILSLLAFAVASVLRFFPDDFDGDLFEAARIIYIIDIILFIVRSFQMFSVSRQLGPKLVMIKTMLEDLKQFVIILAVFIISYGVALQAALYPNTTNFWDVLKGIIEKPYFQMYGELFYEDFAEDPTIHGDGKWLGPTLLGIYMLLTNVLLLNLLIAIFNYTFEKIQESSDRVWKFKRYGLIREFHDRPTLVPPLMILSHIYIFIKWMVQMCGCGTKPVYGSALKLTLSEHENDQLTSWENHSRDLGLLRTKAEEEEQMEKKVKNIDAKVDELSNQIERMMEASLDPGGRGENGSGKSDKPRRGIKSAHYSRNFETSISSRVECLEERLIQTSNSIEKILEIVSSSAYGANRAEGRSKYMDGRKSIHVKSRKSPYPQSTIMRIPLTDELVAWEAPFSNYNPPTYTSDWVKRNPPWADIDIMSKHPRPMLKFNEFDAECNVNRQSYNGTYKVVDGLPFNPMGRTGLTGRGLLGRFGPNHAADPIVTRWKMTSSGALIEHGKKVLEFVAIQRKDNQEWAIPGGMVEPGQQISATLKKEFMEEALAGLDMDDEERKELKRQVDILFQGGTEVFKGYVDDPRNTDVAWIETTAMNYHDDSGEVFNKIKLQAGDDATAVRWQRVSGNIPLYANHVAMLENVARLHNANF